PTFDRARRQRPAPPPRAPAPPPRARTRTRRRVGRFVMDKLVDTVAGSPPRGLYRPDTEHDACGVGFVANVHGARSHAVLADALTVLTRMEHRGGAGCDPLTGDGAGVLFQLPHEFLAAELGAGGVTLPERGRYGLGMFFLPRAPAARRACEQSVERAA